MVAAAKMLIYVLLHTCFTMFMFPTITFIIVPSKTEFVDSLTPRIVFYNSYRLKDKPSICHYN